MKLLFIAHGVLKTMRPSHLRKKIDLIDEIILEVGPHTAQSTYIRPDNAVMHMQSAYIVNKSI